MRRWLLCCLTLAAACGGSSVTSVPITPIQPPVDSATFAGFDIKIYPGDAALQAWKYPASPYRWIGYYLRSPCDRDVSYAGKRATIAALGWGIAAIYVGQQDWANMSVAPTGATANVASQQLAVCSASLLSSDQGTAEAKDAVAQMRAEGFPDGSTVFLDIEHVTTIGQSLLDYYRAWIAGVLADGHFKPAVYAARSNASTFYDQSIVDLHGTRYTPPFWIAGTGGFTTSSRPTDVGLSFAQLWQGLLDVKQTYNGVTLTIDADVSSKLSPSAP